MNKIILSGIIHVLTDDRIMLYYNNLSIELVKVNADTIPPYGLTATVYGRLCTVGTNVAIAVEKIEAAHDQGQGD